MTKINERCQRKMAWFALFGMLLYPFAVVLANLMGLEQSTILGDMAQHTSYQ